MWVVMSGVGLAVIFAWSSGLISRGMVKKDQEWRALMNDKKYTSMATNQKIVEELDSNRRLSLREDEIRKKWMEYTHKNEEILKRWEEYARDKDAREAPPPVDDPAPVADEAQEEKL